MTRQQKEWYIKILMEHRFEAENSDYDTFYRYYRLGDIGGLEDFIHDEIVDDFLGNEIWDPAYLLYYVYLDKQKTEYTFIPHGYNANNAFFYKDAKDADVFESVMQEIANDELFIQLQPSFQDVLQLVDEFDDFDLYCATDEWHGIMMGEDFYEIYLEEGDYVVCYYGGQNKPDSFYFITKEEAEKILETGEW